MNGLNPIAGSIYQASTVQRMQAGERDSAVRRVQARKKNVGTAGEDVEHSVESSDVISPLHDEERAHDERKRKRQRSNENLPTIDDRNDPPRLDLTA